MQHAQANGAGMLWWAAVRRRWALRQAAGESRWQLAVHMASWVHLCVRQTRWLHAIHARDGMRRAAEADPRLYERWHRPYVSAHFDADARRRIVGSHYAFLMRRFPARLCERIVLGGGVRMATLRLEDGSEACVHLRKPSRADTGELALVLLTGDKEVLASCTLTFDRGDSMILGAVQGAGAHTPFEATRGFMQGSHGLDPRDLLMALVRELAAVHGLVRIRAVSAAACVGDAPCGAGVDAFWRGHGGVPAGSGCHELPLSLAPTRCAGGPRSRREQRERREAFLRQACERFAASFRGTRHAGAVPAPRDVTPARSQTPAVARSRAERGGLLAAGL